MKKYILLYSDKKQEDNICLLNMFKEHKKIGIAWTDVDVSNNVKMIEKLVGDGYEEIIFAGFEMGFDNVISMVRRKVKDIIIKVICNTQDSLLYYDYERENFFKLLELSKNKVFDEIAFLRKGQYEVYKELGYKCCYLYENYVLDKKYKLNNKGNKKISLGFYPLDYLWNKNIFNQLCVAKMLDNALVVYNELDERMTEFLETMKIDARKVKIGKDIEGCLIDNIVNNDVVISTSFTEYFHPVFFIAMELGVPCLCGNTSDLFSDKDELRKYIVTTAEDNAIINAEMIDNIIKNKDKINELYRKWKDKYNKIAQNSLEDFIG